MPIYYTRQLKYVCISEIGLSNFSDKGRKCSIKKKKQFFSFFFSLSHDRRASLTGLNKVEQEADEFLQIEQTLPSIHII